MQKNKINEIASDVKSFLAKESGKAVKINQLEDRINKMQNYDPQKRKHSSILNTDQKQTLPYSKFTHSLQNCLPFTDRKLDSSHV